MISINYEDKILTADVNMSMRDIYRAENDLRAEFNDHREWDRAVTGDGLIVTEIVRYSTFTIQDGWTILYREGK